MIWMIYKLFRQTQGVPVVWKSNKQSVTIDWGDGKIEKIAYITKLNKR